MSKIAPHNAQIEYAQGTSGPYVKKRFRGAGKFTARQEATAYQGLCALLDSLSGTRAAKVLAVDDDANTLYLEFIEGPTMYERLAQGETEILDQARERLLYIFKESRDAGFRFDCDPSNILFEPGTQGGENLVFIDPSCIALPIRDHAFIVFMWGLIKILVRDWRMWRAGRLKPYWNAYCRGYCRISDVSGASLAQQMVAYIDLVIEWNKERNHVESVSIYYFRRLIVAPIYRAVRLWFVWRPMPS
jgi:hypothetical protein